MEDSYETVLRWPHTDAKEVIVSGDFDQWSNSVHLVKDESGFGATVRIPWGAKVEYKFLVDGQWKVSEAPTETDPSGKYVNNVVIAPPKPQSTVSSAISYVASGLGGAFQSLTGVSSIDAAEEPEVPVETSTKDVALAETPAAAAIASTSPIPTEPVEKAPPSELISTVISVKQDEQGAPEPEHVTAPAAPESEKTANPKSKQIVAASPEPTIAPAAPDLEQATSGSEINGAPAVPEPEASTHTPVTFSSKPGSSKSVENENGAPVPPALSASGSAAVAPAAAAVKMEPSAGQSNPAEPLPEGDDKTSTAGKMFPTENGKHAFPGSLKGEGDGVSSKTGSSSMRKKRRSIFGRASEVDDGDSSKYDSIARKKKRSFFGKVKHLFDHKD